MPNFKILRKLNPNKMILAITSMFKNMFNFTVAGKR